jgi:hypothetical protein
METDPIPIEEADPAVPFNRLFGKVPAQAGGNSEAHSRALPQTTLFVFFIMKWSIAWLSQPEP